MPNEDTATSRVPTTFDELSETADWFAAPDFHLRRLAELADMTGAGCSVTLVTSGVVISGEVIPADDFFQGTGDDLKEAAKPDDPDTQETFRSFAELMFDGPAQQYRERRESDDGDDNAALQRVLMTRYIHLKNVFLTIPGHESTPRPYMRVLLSHVSAWSLGALQLT